MSTKPKPWQLRETAQPISREVRRLLEVIRLQQRAAESGHSQQQQYDHEVYLRKKAANPERMRAGWRLLVGFAPCSRASRRL